MRWPSIPDFPAVLIFNDTYQKNYRYHFWFGVLDLSWHWQLHHSTVRIIILHLLAAGAPLWIPLGRSQHSSRPPSWTLAACSCGTHPLQLVLSALFLDCGAQITTLLLHYNRFTALCHQNPTTQSLTGGVPFLPRNQQCQSTEGKNYGHLKPVSRPNWIMLSIMHL